MYGPLLPGFRRQRFSTMGCSQRTKSCLKRVIFYPILLLILIFHLAPFLRFLVGLIPMDKCSLESGQLFPLDNTIDATIDFRARLDVQTCTSWRAPIIWEGMFDPSLFDYAHKSKGSSVALTVFAVGRYLDAYLEAFLKSSEKYFMQGLPVTYYVFTDAPQKMPHIKLGPQRSIKVFKVERHSRWQDISMMRMKTISDFIESDIRHCCTHVFCFDVDQVFTGRFGSEALGESVALLHAHYYHLPRRLYTYDRNPRSQAYMTRGDFYYHAAIFGGTWKSVKALVDACHESIMQDKKNNVEALWHDESHLNKYMWLYKPTRLLSPEYCWDTNIGYRRDIRVTRLRWAPKDYQTLRML